MQTRELNIWSNLLHQLAIAVMNHIGHRMRIMHNNTSYGKPSHRVFKRAGLRL